MNKKVLATDFYVDPASKNIFPNLIVFTEGILSLCATRT